MSFTKSNQTIAESYGYPNLFKTRNLEELSNETCHKICLWMKDHTDKDLNPFKEWLSTRRKAKKGKGKTAFYESDQAIAESYGYPNLFETRNLEELSNETCHKVCLWMKDHNDKVPSMGSLESNEKFIGTWVSNKRKSKKGGSRGTLYPSDQVIAESYGYPNLFETRNLEELSNEICHKICLWMKDHNDKTPSTKSSDSEKTYAVWLSGKRRSKQGLGVGTLYRSDQAIAESYGYPNLFETRNLEELSNETCHKICLWMKDHNKTPSKDSKDSEEGFFGRWVSTKRAANKSKGHGSFYPSDQAIAESYGYPDLFITKR